MLGHVTTSLSSIHYSIVCYLSSWWNRSRLAFTYIIVFSNVYTSSVHVQFVYCVLFNFFLTISSPTLPLYLACIVSPVALQCAVSKSPQCKWIYITHSRAWFTARRFQLFLSGSQAVSSLPSSFISRRLHCSIYVHSSELCDELPQFITVYIDGVTVVDGHISKHHCIILVLHKAQRQQLCTESVISKFWTFPNYSQYSGGRTSFQNMDNRV